MKPIEVKVLAAAVDEYQARTVLEVFTGSPGAAKDQPRFRMLNDRWLAARDALRAVQVEFVQEINSLRVLAPVVLP